MDKKQIYNDATDVMSPYCPVDELVFYLENKMVSSLGSFVDKTVIKDWIMRYGRRYKESEIYLKEFNDEEFVLLNEKEFRAVKVLIQRAKSVKGKVVAYKKKVDEPFREYAYEFTLEIL